MAEEKKKAPEKKAPAKKKEPVDISLNSLNKMAIKGHKARKEE